MKDYFAILEISKQELCEDKDPPICDSCNDPLEQKKSPEGQELGVFEVPCLILNGDQWNASFWGVICPKCAAGTL